MAMQSITVGRFPNGSWTTGGPVTDSVYEECEVYVVPFTNEADAKKKAQAVRRALLKKGQSLPSQAAPYRAAQ